MRAGSQVRAASPARALALGHADDRGGQRAGETVGPAIERRGGPACALRRPSRAPVKTRTGTRVSAAASTAEDPRLGAVGVQHVGALAAHQRHQLEQSQRVARAERAANVTQRDVACARVAHRVAQRARRRGRRRRRRSARPAPARARPRRSARLRRPTASRAGGSGGGRQRASTSAPSSRSDVSRPKRARAAASATGSPSVPATMLRRHCSSAGASRSTTPSPLSATSRAAR